MSDPVPPVSDPIPAPATVDPPVVNPVVPTEEGSQVDTLGGAIGHNYLEHVLDDPYHGWAFNGIARIELNGQRIFELIDDGTPVQYGTPPDLI
jgi:hypothetical protein